MERSYDSVTDDDSPNPSRKIIMHPLYLPRSSPWFELRVFYVRLSNCEVDDYTPEHLTLNHIPLTPDTIFEMNGKRSGIYSDCVSSSLRRDRVDKKSDEATFVSTDSLRITGSVRFEVYDKDDLLLCGVLELCNGNGYVKESKIHSKKWNMKCQSSVSPGSSFLKGKQYMTVDVPSPTVEVYVAGCFSGTPIILTKTLQLGFRKKHQMKAMLNCIPEYEGITDKKKESPFEDPLQLSEYQDYKTENYMDMDYNSIYSRAEFIDEDGELSWFNAGVRVGVGIGLGVCVGVGIGVGLLIRTYQATTRNFRRRLI
ncbi:DNA polymerase palm domain-containing protein [Dioscorea alata]|uniref:DNA polymerase palm domain-containing protein n=4 Tax=Dioscorea alata TaxID=55571 RepID=A0ACB7UW52_DIOAL|nr:DNA polymerase palm domain-containing protein [Dioscorea alata]KAH7665109.1 DNA polymerase palm domain-containing protein [Dioscorea alata]KAH7665110.1 DNA polymerase palm domain-containing protein [Dioscorea alata]KAH7665111.1 DNA polymerase palm domain-containing protein [Dioscorea alata]